MDGGRITSIDVLRGIAVLGILPMNIQGFSMVGAAYWNPTAYGDLRGANLWVWLLSHLLTDQKFLNIFCMLFGAGIVLFASNAEASGRQPAPLHYRRMGLLVLFGILHGWLLWSGDILFDYGVCGMILFPLRELRPRALVAIGLAAMAVASGIQLAYGASAAHWPASDLREVKEQLWQPTPQEVAGELAEFRGGWRAQMQARAADAFSMETFFFWAWGLWRESGMMLAGMALFQWGVLSARRPAAFYWRLIAAALCVGIPVTLYGTLRDFAHAWDFLYSFFYGMQFNYWASPLVSLGWIGAAMLACRAAALPAATRVLAAVGRMAFTNYILQTAICTTMFYGHGFGLFGKVERTGQFAIVLGVWAVELAISPLWLRHFRFGPLEWIWRSGTYGRWEPLRT